MSKLKKIFTPDVCEIITGAFTLILLFVTMYFYMLLC